MSIDIQIGKIGQITSGEEGGSYIKIVEDTKKTGGYFILRSIDINFSYVYDDWVEKLDYLPDYFAEAKWIVKWLPDK